MLGVELLGGEQGLGPERVTDVAPEVERLAPSDFVESAAALGTDEPTADAAAPPRRGRPDADL